MTAAPHPRAIARRTAVIDLGSNSFRLVVFSVGEAGWWKRTDELSETVRLGGDLGPNGELSPQRMAHALETLRVFAAFCATNGLRTDQIDAVATSAVRDAPNGEEFVQRARRATGLPVRILSQRDEAWFSYIAAVNATTLSDGIVLDIGGGSMELVAVEGRRAIECVSWQLGAVRMTERFLPGDEPSRPEQIEALRQHTLSALAGEAWVATAGRSRLAGIGGAVRSLAAAAIRSADLPLDSVQGFVLEPRALDRLIAELAARRPAERDRVPGIKRGRAEVILAGAVVLRAVLEATGAPGIEVVEAGLREGIFRAGELSELDPPIAPDVRRASVENLARQHGVDLVHAEHIAELADQLASALPSAGLPAPGDPELLWAAAILHDVGMAVDYDDHHKHSSYLILGSGLPGFTPREVALIALMARYHRKGTPQLGAAAALCEPGDDELLLRGAALLRIAEQLERNRDQVVHTARLLRTDGEGPVVLELDAEGDTVVAEWAAERQGDLFARAFGAELTVTRS
ncbi:MAG TPA: Ppx/GppA phosphatase family protein [Conexibacter sp.]|jgi:exopolyphosphatase/guanosine-5'-triphosphate,3'-diphosphate pyrophosphatase